MSDGSRRLLTVTWKGQTGIIDECISQIRNAHDLGDFMALDTFEQNIVIAAANASSR